MPDPQPTKSEPPAEDYAIHPSLGIPKKVGTEFMKADKAQGAPKKGAARKK